jgi:hypothetical protein
MLAIEIFSGSRQIAALGDAVRHAVASFFRSANHGPLGIFAPAARHALYVWNATPSRS